MGVKGHFAWPCRDHLGWGIEMKNMKSLGMGIQIQTLSYLNKGKRSRYCKYYNKSHEPGGSHFFLAVNVQTQKGGK